MAPRQSHAHCVDLIVLIFIKLYRVPYHLQTTSQNRFFTQEQSNANDEEHSASL